MTARQRQFPLIEPLGRCPVCGARRLRALHVYRNKRLRVTEAPQLTIAGCERCGVVHTHPLPTAAQLESYYSRPGGWDERDVLDDADLAAAARYESELVKNRERYVRKLKLLRGQLRAPATRTPRVLDFGCGRGEWLDAFADEGWETYGIEPAPNAAAIAEKRHELLGEIPGKPRFDMVLLNHVLEHLHDPRQVLESLADALIPGGQVYISVPDLGRLPSYMDLNYATSDVHIFSYTRASMESLLRFAGLRVEAHLDSKEWDRSAPGEESRLRILAAKRRSPVSLPRRIPSGRLALAVDALRGFGQRDEAEVASGADLAAPE